MQEFIKYIIGVVVLLLGFPIGMYLARFTKDEVKTGQKWFKIIIIISFLCAIISAIIKNDALMFSFLFMAIVTSRSLIK